MPQTIDWDKVATFKFGSWGDLSARYVRASDYDAAVRELRVFESGSLLYAARIQCTFCGNRYAAIFNGRWHPYSDGDVRTEPHRIDQQYVPNQGVMAGWVHKNIADGTLIECEAVRIHDELARSEMKSGSTITGAARKWRDKESTPPSPQEETK